MKTPADICAAYAALGSYRAVQEALGVSRRAVTAAIKGAGVTPRSHRVHLDPNPTSRFRPKTAAASPWPGKR